MNNGWGQSIHFYFDNQDTEVTFNLIKSFDGFCSRSAS